MATEYILVSWVAYGTDPFPRTHQGNYILGEDGQPYLGPSLELLTNPESDYYKKIRRAYFFVRDAPIEGKPRSFHPHELEVFAALREELHQRLPQLKVESRLWTTTEPPTAHRAIFLFTVEQLRAIRLKHPTATLIVNLSPGSPAMQTVMLLALQARVAGDQVEVVQGIPRDKRKTARILDPVTWNLLGELNSLEAEERPIDPGPRWTLGAARSSELRQVAERIIEIGRFPYPVLILGSRGTGKTRVASELRAQHLTLRGRSSSPQSAGWPFRLNCASLPETLLESELFGYEVGAFTGANKPREGLLERASGDCVFLDEIHHLSRKAQAALLVALEHGGEFFRVGGTKPIKADFRLIAATNRTPEQLREDLLPDFRDRITDFTITVPDLVQCRNDLEGIWLLLAQEVAEEVARGLGEINHAGTLFAGLQPFHDEIVRALRRRILPGNWRDLQRLARRLYSRGLSPSALVTFFLRPQIVREELDELARAEGETEGRVARDRTLAAELPTIERCAQAVRDAEARGGVVDFAQLTTEWERRLVDGALRVVSSERRAAPLLGLNARTLNHKRKQLTEP